jgi:multiple sugar transport system permease protein
MNRPYWWMLAPWLTALLGLFAVPTLALVGLSFTEWDFLTAPRWVGLRNYTDIFWEDPRFWQSLRVTGLYTLLYVPTELVGSVLLALLMNQKVRLVGVFRAICYLPTVLSGVASTLIGMWLFHPEGGLVNRMLGGGPRWLLDPHTALLALWLMSLWGLARSALLVLAALQSIPVSLYEAARLDGASEPRAFFVITLPMLAPTLAFNLIMGTAATLQTFSGAYVATAGGPLEATLFYVLYLYQKGFQQLQMGYAAALAVLLFGLCSLIAWARTRLVEEE